MKLLPIRRGEITRTQIGFSVVPVIRGIMNASSGPVVEPGPRRRPAEPQIVGSNPTRPATTPAIFPYVQYLQKEGFKPQTIESHSKILRFLSKYVPLNDPEAVRLFVANQHVSSGRKENEVDVFSGFGKYHEIAFSESRYSREETLPFIAQ